VVLAVQKVQEVQVAVVPVDREEVVVHPDFNHYFFKLYK
jgi:hypothetical protein